MKRVALRIPALRRLVPEQLRQTVTTEDRAERFMPALANAHMIEGMLSDFSIAVMDMLLSLQTRSGISGHIVELGVFRGRSAAVLATHASRDERLILVDVADNFERERLVATYPKTEFLVCTTDLFPSVLSDYRRIAAACRFIHIDASHQFSLTFRELCIADKLLMDGGIIAVDDFANLNYSQNIAAIYKYLFTTRTTLTPLLVTAEKGYLCRRTDFPFYGKFVLDHAINAMALRDVPDALLARTDIDPDYRAFHLRTRNQGEGQFYGFSIYEGCYATP
jgi:predicted O-methyltransferase YrrM